MMAYIESHATASGLIILVDMGSLNAIHRHFNRRLSTPMAIINNVSTGMAMYVGSAFCRALCWKISSARSAMTLRLSTSSITRKPISRGRF
ncbi:hypothetical protein M3O75_29500 [Klebsiella pneumoniae]|nr:hypothetical protein [Klebsiella pneumoniae]